MDTEYTKGFKAGMAWREMEIIRLLKDYSDGELLVIPTGEIATLIKGENNE